MDWLLLIVVVPVVAVAIVLLLFGFAGCALILGLDDVKYSSPPPAPATPPANPPPPPVDPGSLAPVNLVATARGVDHIRLVWSHPDPANVIFKITRIGPSLVPEELPALAQALITTFDDQGPHILAGELYSYTVRAESTTNSTIRSVESNRDPARAWIWRTLYGGANKTLTTNDILLANATLVQRIDPATYDALGNNVMIQRIRITLRGSTNANPNQSLALDQVSVSHRAVPGDPNNLNPEAWDSGPDPAMHRFGATGLPGSGAAVLLPEADFRLDRSRELLVAFDISATNQNVTFGRPNVGASQAVSRVGAPEAGTSNRSANYQQRPAGVYFVERIEVLVSSVTEP